MARPAPNADLAALAETHGTPYQLYDEEAIRARVRQLQSAFSEHFPGFKNYFAVKALPNPAILQLMLDEGCGLDCSSTAELFIADRLGVPGGDVMFTSNYTSREELGRAFDQGVIVNLDDVSLVRAMVEERGRVPELISFRLNPGLGRTDSETASNVLGGPDAKFGVPADQIVEAYRQAQAAGATRFGMHMMTGSCVLEGSYWHETVAVLCDAMAEVGRELGITFEFIDIGGGLGVPYRPGERELELPALAAALRQQLDAWSAASDMPVPQLKMENGRFITGPFGWLVARCRATKQAFGQRFLGLDACMANLMRPGMYGSYHHISVVGRDGPVAPVNVVGSLCENNDWFAKQRELPGDAGEGDLLVVHDTGAHAHSMGFQYNGKLRAPELLLRGDGSVALIRERERVEDLFANCVSPQ